jgi:tachylectin/trypsin
MKSFVGKGILLVASALAGAPFAFAEEHLGRSQSPLISDVVVTEDQQEQLGLLQLTANGRGCSATLITNDWVLTAAHCLDAAAMRMPASAQVNGNWGPARAQFGNADYIYRSWGLNDSGGMYDFALLHLPRGLRVHGTTTGYVRELSDISISDMLDVNVAVYGRGMNTLAFKNQQTNVDMQSTGDNQFRSFVFTVKRLEPNLFWFPKGEKGEMVGGGDSGGPSFEVTRGSPRIAGVHALCHTDCLAGHQCPASDSWTWVSNIRECGDAPVGNFRGAIYGLMKQAWNPALPVQTLQMLHAEAEVQKELLLGQLDTLPWDYVRRTAQFACRNRGFDSGFFDGNYQAGVRYQMRCLNASTGAWFDALPPDMLRINEKFTTIVNLGWAQGARAAGELCKNRNPAFVAGMLTGFEAKSSNPGGFADLRDGVWCFNNSSATWIDASVGEFSAQGTPIGDLNTIGWAPAARAAAQYCRRKNFPAGGFFNGHQLNDKRGVICLGQNSLISDRASAMTDTTSYAGAARAQAQTEATRAASAGLPRGARVTQSATVGRQSAVIAALGAAQASSAAAVPVITPAPGATNFYAIDGKGALIRYSHNLPETGSVPNASVAAVSGWSAYDAVIPAGGNHLYARAGNGDLLWFQHNPGDAANPWNGPVKVGHGWQSFTQIIGGGNGVIYAIAPDGSLQWYRHAGFATGDPNSWLGPTQVGTGWGDFRNVFSSGEGVLYAVTKDGKLMVYHHLDPANGAMRWSGPVQVGTGWSGFAQLFSAGNGVIYGLATDGKLSYYRHLTWNAPAPTFKWVGPVPAGVGLDPAMKVTPLLP